MIAVNNEAGCWPTPDQELLLRAALLQREQALESWNEWRRKVNIDVIDYGSHRMVPQLYRNLQRHGVKDPLMDRLKGVYRYYLYKNEILMHRIGTSPRSVQRGRDRDDGPQGRGTDPALLSRKRS